MDKLWTALRVGHFRRVDNFARDIDVLTKQKSAAVVVAALQVKLRLLFLALLFGHSECVADLLVKPLAQYSLQHVFERVTLRRFCK